MIGGGGRRHVPSPSLLVSPSFPLTLSLPPSPSPHPQDSRSNNTFTHLILALLGAGSVPAALHTVHVAGCVTVRPSVPVPLSLVAFLNSITNFSLAQHGTGQVSGRG